MDDIVFFGEPIRRRTVSVHIVGRRKGEPRFGDDIGPPDTDVPMTFVEMAARGRALGTPCEEPCNPLPFDPDDYPFR